jgi:hypothetical protein
MWASVLSVADVVGVCANIDGRCSGADVEFTGPVRASAGHSSFSVGGPLQLVGDVPGLVLVVGAVALPLPADDVGARRDAAATVFGVEKIGRAACFKNAER